MKYKLIKPVNPNYSTLEQILTNREIPLEEISHYTNTTDEDINDYLLLNENKLHEGSKKLLYAILNNLDAILPVDCDVDGYYSAAMFINFLHNIFPWWVDNHLNYIHHNGEKKHHGLKDCIDYIVDKKFPLVIVLDAGTNDIVEHKKIVDYGGNVLVIDHHLLEGEKSQYATIINNQIENYPNKELSGAGVTWQFCRYFNSLLDEECQVDMDKYLDTVSIALLADMMSLKSIETKHLINKGLSDITNPFIFKMWEKNKFKLGDSLTGWGVVFYIAPFINAIARSGTQEEKDIVFRSMIYHEAFKMIPSTKRGCAGQEEKLVDQAIRICTNVKNRQDKKVKEGMEYLENMIENNHMMDNKILLFLLEPGLIDRNIAGLVANKMMAKYQRPCCVLTKVNEDGKITYQGSARGCDKVGINDFKQVCSDTGCVEYTIGHANAFGLSVRDNNISEFIKMTNEALKDISDEPIYYVDYIYDGENVDWQNILDIADMDCYWGKDVDESFIAIRNLTVTKDMVTLMSANKNPTLKITLPNRISIIKFSSSQEEYEMFDNVQVDIIGKCNKNEWLGNITPQIFIEDYEFKELITHEDLLSRF